MCVCVRTVVMLTESHAKSEKITGGNGRPRVWFDDVPDECL